MKTIIKLIVPFTFSDEKEYLVNLISKPAKIRISHFKNNDVIEKIKGIKYQGSPRMVPDDPEGIMYVSDIEIELLYSPDDLADLRPDFDPVTLMRSICIEYLNRLIEVIRFTTRRYLKNIFKSGKFNTL